MAKKPTSTDRKARHEASAGHDQTNGTGDGRAAADAPMALRDEPPERAAKSLSNKDYLAELARLQIELVKLQEWIRHKGLKVVVLFEGRDAAGKGGAIKRITESMSPRVARVVALPAPTEREKPSGTSNATSRTCRRPARWSCSIAPGTTVPASSA
jgi:polyphosphate kinase 2 (PPK2 family)